MVTMKKILRLLAWLGISLLQVISTQIVTFFFSFAFAFLPGGAENAPETIPVFFVLVVGISYTIGIFLTGWFAARSHWLPLQAKPLLRLLGTLVGVFVSLLAALLLYHPLHPGNPFFFIAILTGILGFYLGGFIQRKSSTTHLAPSPNR